MHGRQSKQVTFGAVRIVIDESSAGMR